MKLQYIYIKDYRVLHNFELDFTHTAPAPNGSEPLAPPEDYTLDLLVGVNGTGKSSLLRALAEIFQRLRRYEKPGFGFALKYQTQAYPEGIFISNLNQDTHEILEPDQPLLLRVGTSNEEEVDVIDGKYLPPWIVAFTSGNEQGWELPDDATNENQATGSNEPPLPTSNDTTLRSWYLSELPGKPVEENRSATTHIDSNFLFISVNLIPLVVLCGLLFDMQQDDSPDKQQNRLLQQALQECKIKSLRGFSLKFRMNTELLLAEDRAFIKKLDNIAHHTIQTGSDYLLVFSLENSDSPPQTTPPLRTIRPKNLLDLEGGSIGLFRSLARLQNPDGDEPSILREVNLFLAGNRSTPKKGQEQQNSPLHLFEWLSDGEQSFLSRLCLLSLLANAEALVLLDEPEVHFNDYWKGQLIRMIVLALQQQETHSHVFMTTHSSITLSDVSRRNIWILQREQDYTERAIPPNLRTLGTDPGDISVAVFGSENAVGSQSVQYIFQTINDARKLDGPQQRTKLSQLLREVGPGYWRYLLRREIDALGDPQT